MVDRQTYDAKLRAIASMIADDEVMDVLVEHEVSRLFGDSVYAADDEMCGLVGQVVVDAMKAMREYDRTYGAAGASTPIA
jgi:hypothetical protein